MSFFLMQKHVFCSIHLLVPQEIQGPSNKMYIALLLLFSEKLGQEALGTPVASPINSPELMGEATGCKSI